MLNITHFYLPSANRVGILNLLSFAVIAFENVYVFGCEMLYLFSTCSVSQIYLLFYVFLYTVLLKCINIIFSLFRQEKYLVYELSFEIISKHEKDIQINKPTEFSTD